MSWPLKDKTSLEELEQSLHQRVMAGIAAMRRFGTILGAAGLVICLLFVSKIGGASVIRQLKAARVGVLILIGFSFLRLALQTIAWSTALRAEGIRASALELMGVRLASQSAGYLSVLGPAVSEPMRIRLLLNKRREGSGMAATIADSGVYGLTSCIVGILGCACAGHVMARGAPMAPLILLGAGLLIGAIAITRSRPVLRPIVGSLGIRAPLWLKKSERIEAEVRQFGIRHRIPVCLMFGSDLACQILLAGDIVVVAWCLGIPFHAVTVLALEAATRAARMLAGWIPARIGVDETGAIAAFAALGLPSASGLALAFARRLRDLIGCALGFAWLLWTSRSSRGCEFDTALLRLGTSATLEAGARRSIAAE